MEYGEEIKLFDRNWAMIHFVENNGMAFGFSLGGDYGKLALSLFRIFAVIFLCVYIIKLVKLPNISNGLVVSFSLILAGAIGNIIDSAFYGLIFTESPYHGGLAQMVKMGQGYGTFLHGKVVDMFYFPLMEGIIPSWVPIWGGEPFIFFRPVFNVADSAITTGVICILLFFRKYFNQPTETIKTEETIITPQEDTTEETVVTID
jgi:signal peptidase II